MVVAEFKNDKFTSVYGLRQWDFGQELLIKGTGIQGKTVEVHFALERDNVALRILGTIENENITVCIPDILLQSGNSIYAYVYKSTDTEGKTTHEIFMHVSPRAKPEDYTEKEFKNALQQVLAIAQSVREEADAGKFNATDEQVKQVVDAYMEENPVAITVDKTLTQSGKAADAKVTGDKFLQYAIKNTVSGESPLTITDSAEEMLQDIKLLGKSEQTQTTGAQLIPFPYVDKDTTKNGVTFTVKEDGGIKVYGTSTETVTFVLATIDYGTESIFNNGTGNGKIISGGEIDNTYGNQVSSGITNGTVTIKKKVKSLKFVLQSDTDQNAKWTDVMIEYGNKKTDYEPYREPKTVKLSLDQPLRGTGKYKDEITKDGIIRRVWSEVKNTIPSFLDFDANGNYKLAFDPKKPLKNDGVYKIPCDITTNMISYINISSIYWLPKAEELQSMGVNIQGTAQDARTKILEYLSKNPMTIQYALKEPIIEPLPEEFEQILKLNSYYPTTVISTYGGEVDPGVEVTYVADTKNHLDNKVSTNVANIISQYQTNLANLLSLMPIETQATMIEKDTNKILEREVTR